MVELARDQISPNLFGGGPLSNVRTITGTDTITKDDLGKQIIFQNTSDVLPTVTIDETGMIAGDRLFLQGDPSWGNMSRTVRVVSTNDYYFGIFKGVLLWSLRCLVLEFTGSMWKIVSEGDYNNNLIVTYLTSSMSHDTIQDIIHAAPRQSGLNPVDFYFGAGTYTLDSSIYTGINFLGFNFVRIFGDTSINTLSTAQDVNIIGQADTSVFFIYRCQDASINGFKITLNTPLNNSRYCVITESCTYFDARYNYYLNTYGTRVGAGVYTLNSTARLLTSYYNNLYWGIRCYNALISSYNSVTIGTSCEYGLRAEYGGVIGKVTTQPTGNTANEYVVNGGVIR